MQSLGLWQSDSNTKLFPTQLSHKKTILGNTFLFAAITHHNYSAMREKVECCKGLKGPRGRLGETALPSLAALALPPDHCLKPTCCWINIRPTASIG